jgi:anti-sigma factor RsiW
MNCRETRELLFAFLDNELEAHASIELQVHLERCGTCAREAEIERSIRRGLRATLGGPEDARARCELLPAALRAPAVVARGGAGRRRWFAAAGILASLAGGGALWRGLGGGDERALTADAIVGDFEHFLARGRPLDVTSADPAEVERWIEAELALSAPLPAVEAPGRLVGARSCTIAGRVAALALYELGGSPAALLVTTGGALDSADLEDGGASGIRGWIEHRGPYVVVAGERGGLTFAAVGSAPETELCRLVPAPEHRPSGELECGAPPRRGDQDG